MLKTLSIERSQKLVKTSFSEKAAKHDATFDAQVLTFFRKAKNGFQRFYFFARIKVFFQFVFVSKKELAKMSQIFSRAEMNFSNVPSVNCCLGTGLVASVVAITFLNLKSGIK